MENQNDQMLQEILKVVQSVQENAATKQDIHDILETVKSVQENAATKQDVQDILETVNFIKDNAATKTEVMNIELSIEKQINDFKVEVSQEFKKVDQRLDEVVGHVDAFAKLHETLDQELVSLRGKYDRLEERLVKVEQKLGFATA